MPRFPQTVFGSSSPSSSMPEASGPEEVPVSTGAGTAYTTRNKAGLRSMLYGPASDPLSGSGWGVMAPTGGATATWISGPSRLLLDCPGVVGQCGVESSDYVISPEYYEFMVRMRVISGDGSNATRVGFNVGRNGSNTANVTLWTSGSIEPGFVSNGSFNSLGVISVSDINDALRTSGNLCIKMSRTPDSIVWSYGVVSSGPRPLWWVPIFKTDNAGAMAASSGRFVQLYQLVLSGGVHLSVEFSAIESGLPGGF